MSLPEFSGPLDLLYGLIQKRRLDVTALSLAAVADQYLEQVLLLEGELEALSEFLQLGSQLLLIKSRALLPAARGDAEAEDPADELRRRLAEYQVLRAAAEWLGERESSGTRSWPRGADTDPPSCEAQLASLSPARLVQLALTRRLRGAPAGGTLELPWRPTLRERAEVLLGMARPGGWIDLDEVVGADVPTAVATFLALLVLVRRGILAVRQEAPYSHLSYRLIVHPPIPLNALDG